MSVLLRQALFPEPPLSLQALGEFLGAGPPPTNTRAMADEEVHVEKETSRAQRDSEGWANAIVISSDEDEPSGPSAAAAARPKPSSAGASSSTAAGKRPARSQDVKPDVKSFKPNHPPNSGVSNDPGGFGGLPPNDLTADLAFSTPIKFSQGHSDDSPRRAGHLMLDISAWGNRDTGDAPVIVGTGRELSALSRLLCLSHSADVAVKDGTAGNQVLAALRKLADPSQNNHIVTVLHEIVNHVLEIKHLRTAFYKSNIVYRK